MPLYEYRCQECGCEFEELASGEAKVPCPKCNFPETEKLMSACRHKSGGSGGDYASSAPASSGGGCAGCAGGSCASCH
jgi:putative FmdB family regulatory protein